jgi:hypothetical protein
MTEIAPAEDIREATTDPLRTVITPDGWKFTWSTIGYNELYNLNEDPYEMNNVFTDHPDLIEKFCHKIKNWQEATGDAIELPFNLN